MIWPLRVAQAQFSHFGFFQEMTPPSVESIIRQSPVGQSLNGEVSSVVFRVNFSENLSVNPATNDFTFGNVSGAISGNIGSIVAVTGTMEFDVTINSLSDSGEFRLELDDTDNSIKNTNNDSLQNPNFATGQTYIRDGASPAPGNSGVISSTNISSTTLDLNWTKGTDNISADSELSYSVYRSTTNDMATIATTENKTFVGSGADLATIAVSALSPSTTYYFNIVIADEAGNKAIYSTTNATTLAAGDTTPPVAGNSGIIGSGSLTGTSVTLSWTKGTDNVTAQADLNYKVFQSSTNNMTDVASTESKIQISNATDVASLNVTGLSPGTTYYFNILLTDQASNKSIYSTTTVTTTNAVATPVFSIAAGSYPVAQTVAISTSTGGATIYYTTNGSEPTTASAVYSTPLSVSQNTTVKAFGVKSGISDSIVASAVYDFVVSFPSASVRGGNYSSAQSVSLSTLTSGATIYYTLNGTTPTTASSVYSSALNISTTTTLKAMAAKSGWTSSSVTTEIYTIVNPLVWSDVSEGTGSHICGIKTNGTLWCWGLGTGGQLGDGTTVSRALPVQVGSATNWASVKTGDQFTCARKSDNTLWCWGYNFKGQVGDGTSTTRSSPVQIGGAEWSKISTSAENACAIKTNGTLWCWGYNYKGSLGDGTTTNRSTPTQVGSLTTWSEIAKGRYHTCAIQAGKLWCWGDGGAVGDGTNTPDKLSPLQIGALTTWRNISAGASSTCSTKTDNKLWCWGYNTSGYIGDGTNTNRTAPIQIGTATDWSSTSLSSTTTCGIRTGGNVWCWGYNARGAVGNGNLVDQWSPVQESTATTWTKIVRTGDATCGIKSTGALWCWGDDTNGLIADKKTLKIPTRNTNLGATDWKEVHSGSDFSCAIKTNGTLWCWGSGTTGQLGNGASLSSETPVQVGALTTWSKLILGGSHACAIKTDGTVWCWGFASYGQIGYSGVVNQTSPRQESSLSVDWSKINLGLEHTCAIKTDGSLWCWGRNASSQLGDNTTTQKNNPLQVGTDLDWMNVAAGNGHTCAIKNSGTLWCWGLNSSYQLGDGTNTLRGTPTQIGTNTSWNTLAAGAISTCATRTDGTLWCWGANASGQLGDGTTLTKTAPVQIGSGQYWLEVTMKLYTTYGYGPAGTKWRWGSNANGQLADGSLTNSLTPSLLENYTTWSNGIGHGDKHAGAIDFGGRLWSWGLGSSSGTLFGFRGDGYTGYYTIPTQLIL